MLRQSERNGYAWMDEDLSFGDNPNSDVTETYAIPSSIVITNATLPQSMLHSALLHEFVHAVQFGMDAFESQGWLWEATATWTEKELISEPIGLDHWEELIFRYPDNCLEYYGDEWEEGRWYGLWILLRVLTNEFGPYSVRSIWELDAINNTYESWTLFLADHDSTVQSFFQDFYIAMLIREIEGIHKSLVVELEGKASPNSIFKPTDGVGALGADFIEIQGQGLLRIELISDDLDGIIIGIARDKAHGFPLIEKEGVINNDQFETSFLIVTNPTWSHGELICRYSDYSLQIEAGGIEQNPSFILPAPNFIDPY